MEAGTLEPRRLIVEPSQPPSRFSGLTFDLNEQPVPLALLFTRGGKNNIMAHIKNVAIITLATAIVLYQGWLIWDMISP